MTDTPVIVQLRQELDGWLAERILRLCDDVDEGRTLPMVVDWYLVVATEDGADPESDTYYHSLSPGVSHYRKVGLLKCALQALLKDDEP